ncbi:hypothetical protein PMZ80_000764 [Knufia obscura]|uniref:Uncharacterized protein n=1 Tax=Knufia obscura TaxID=1635080 RepID=A0ABR0S199_9EURO|nr:hypothetical protein PMZ80_000764 [Knufia obscura]
MDHFKPHVGATFEGYFSKFTLATGGTIILILCTVPQAEQRRHMLSFTYHPSASSDASSIFQQEVWLDYLDLLPDFEEDVAFVIDCSHGYMKVFKDSRTEYKIKHQSFTFHTITDPKTQTPWTPSSSQPDAPEGLFVHLPFPMHWYVHSLSTKCNIIFTLDDPTYTNSHSIAQADLQPNLPATVHQEKNWATSFPSAHLWIQARNEKTQAGFCLAGGPILGTESYLLSFRSSDPGQKYSFALRPPLTTTLLPSILPASLNPSLLLSSRNISYQTRTATLSFLTSLVPPFRTITVSASADKDSFFSLSAPFADGHRHNFCGQTSRATVKVQVSEMDERLGLWMYVPFVGWKRFGFGTHWKIVHEEVFERGGLEFGAEWYDDRG